MGGQTNLFPKPDTKDPYSNDYAPTGIFEGNEKRPNVDPSAKRKSQTEWEKSINGPQNKIK